MKVFTLKNLALKALLIGFFFAQTSCAPSLESAINSPSLLPSSGLDVFTKPLPEANTFTCNTCHTFSDVENSFRTVGHDLSNAAFRTHYKNGALTTLRDAVNNCVEHWMAGEPWTEENPLWTLLRDFLETGDSQDNSNLSYTIVDPPVDLTGGDTVRGMLTFNQTCATCHGLDGVGTERGPFLAGTTLSAETIASRVRTSGPTDTDVYNGLTGGRMPFWSESRLSDSELKDIISFLDATVPIEPGGSPGETPTDLSLPSAQTSGACGSDHPLIGASGAFSTFSHDVAGTVEVVDNCTLQISNFTFDGGGIDIRIYTGVNGNFSSGSTLSVDLLGTSFSNDTVTVRLPEGITLNDFNSISVWCDPASISFGDTILTL